MIQRAVVGMLAATIIALAAHRAGSLSRSGAIAATLVGVASASAGYGWGALLVIYFVASVALSRLGRARKEARTASIVAKAGARDALQVLANGGLFAACALIAALSPRHAALAAAAALGAIAAATADTWATEIGTLYGRTPRSVLTGRAVSAGTSGGVTLAGSLAMLAGAGFIALVAMALSLPGVMHRVILAGVAGAMADSILGATLQERRWCASCETSSERCVHDCGAHTTLSGGLAWMDNDLVNLLATVAGAAVAVLLAIL